MRSSSTSWRASVSAAGSKPTLRSRKSLPLLGGERLRALGQVVQHVALARAGSAAGASMPNGRPFFSWAMAASYSSVDLGVEAAGQHPLVARCTSSASMRTSFSRRLGSVGQVGVGLGVQPGRDEVDDLDRARARAPAP